MQKRAALRGSISASPGTESIAQRRTENQQSTHQAKLIRLDRSLTKVIRSNRCRRHPVVPIHVVQKTACVLPQRAEVLGMFMLHARASPEGWCLLESAGSVVAGAFVE